VAIVRVLAAAEPANPVWQRDLAIVGRALVPLLIRLGRPEEAVAALEPPMRVGENDLALRFDRARATLYGGGPAAAAEELAALVKLRPADAYFALWLHIARQRNGQDDAAELHDNAGRLDQMKWPWPVVSLLLGSTDANTVRAAAATAADEPTRRGQGCEADFYLGVHAAENGARQDARRLLAAAVATCPHDFAEWSAAGLELKRFDPASASERK
jgi:lipoprotein NlpI